MQITTHPSEVKSLETATRSGTMNILRINFNELYRRHLCRHSQFRLNVLHLLAVYGIYFSIYSLAAIIVRTLTPEQDFAGQALILAILSIPYLVLLLANIPFMMLIATAVSIVLIICVALLESTIPFWGHMILIVLWHRFQLWSHRRYSLHRDMSEFKTKYRKGPYLFILLAVYELPILLYYLISGRRDWTR